MNNISPVNTNSFIDTSVKNELISSTSNHSLVPADQSATITKVVLPIICAVGAALATTASVMAFTASMATWGVGLAIAAVALTILGIVSACGFFSPKTSQTNNTPNNQDPVNNAPVAPKPNRGPNGNSSKRVEKNNNDLNLQKKKFEKFLRFIVKKIKKQDKNRKPVVKDLKKQNLFKKKVISDFNPFATDIPNKKTDSNSKKLNIDWSKKEKISFPKLNPINSQKGFTFPKPKNTSKSGIFNFPERNDGLAKQTSSEEVVKNVEKTTLRSDKSKIINLSKEKKDNIRQSIIKNRVSFLNRLKDIESKSSK